MTGTNQIYPYGVDDGANVLSPANYLASTARLAGVVAGTASSTLANTAWRQSSVIASALAQFVVDATSLDVLDDGNVTAFETKFRSALATLLVSSNPPLFSGSDTSSVNTQVTATLTPAMSGYVNEALYLVKMNTTPSGPVQASFNGLPNAQIVKAGAAALTGNEWYAGDVVALSYNGSQLVLLNDNSLATTINLNVPSQYASVNSALIAASQILVATNAYVNINVAAGTYQLTSTTGPIYISHQNGQRINIIGAALTGAFPVASDIAGKSNAACLTFLQGRFQTIFNAVGTDAVQVRSTFRSIQNCLFIGDGTTSGGHYGIKVGDWSTEIGAGFIALQNCWFHGFGLANVRLEQSAFVQGNNLGTTYGFNIGSWIVHYSTLEVNSGNFLSMYNGAQGVLLSNFGLLAIPTMTGTMDISYNTSHGVAGQYFGQFSASPTTALNIKNNGGWGCYMSGTSVAQLSAFGDTFFGGNASGDCYAQIDSFIATYGCSLPSGSSPSRGSGTPSNTQSFVY